MQDMPNFPSKLWQLPWNAVSQGSSLETRHPGFVLGADHRDTLWLPEGKQVLSINHTVCTDGLGTVSHSYQLGWWEPSRKPRSGCQPRANLAKRPFKGQQSQACMETLFCTETIWETDHATWKCEDVRYYCSFCRCDHSITKKKSYLLEIYPEIFTDKMIQCLLFASKMGWGGVGGIEIHYWSWETRHLEVR